MKISKIIGLGWVISIIILSCSPMDEYKDFIKNKSEIQYTGKIDSVLVYSGKERVMIRGLFLSDPKITECRIYWNSKLDSVSIPVERTEGVDTLEYILNIPENSYNFEIYTFDNKGNSSVPVYAMGTSYGSDYEKSLPNRVISGIPMYIEGEGLNLNWYSMDKTLGPVRTDITYTNNDNEVVKASILTADNEQKIHDYKRGTSFTYQTLFLPDSLCLDTFKCAISKEIFPISNINKTDWSILNFSSEEASGEGPVNGRAKCLIDDDINTFWHSNWSGAHPGFPHYVSINLGQEHSIAGIEIVPRQGTTVTLKNFNVLGSHDGENWELIGSFKMEQINNSGQYFLFEERVNVQYVQLYMISSYTGDLHTHLGEVYLFE